MPPHPSRQSAGRDTALTGGTGNPNASRCFPPDAFCGGPSGRLWGAGGGTERCQSKSEGSESKPIRIQVAFAARPPVRNLLALMGAALFCALRPAMSTIKNQIPAVAPATKLFGSSLFIGATPFSVGSSLMMFLLCLYSIRFCLNCQ